ncbi:MAG: hypothetical protein QG635_2385, partial [Bacteroidota bacterium]|nr:hypothetical protein [Bacteroidota bacterium]
MKKDIEKLIINARKIDTSQPLISLDTLRSRVESGGGLTTNKPISKLMRIITMSTFFAIILSLALFIASEPDNKPAAEQTSIEKTADNTKGNITTDFLTITQKKDSARGYQIPVYYEEPPSGIFSTEISVVPDAAVDKDNTDSTVIIGTFTLVKSADNIEIGSKEIPDKYNIKGIKM